MLLQYRVHRELYENVNIQVDNVLYHVIVVRKLMMLFDIIVLLCMMKKLKVYINNFLLDLDFFEGIIESLGS